MIAAAGVLMNALLAVVLIAAGYRLGFPQAISDQPSKYAQISDQHIEVMGVLPDSPAAQSGLNVGDRILAVGVASETAALRELQNSEDFRNVTKELVGESVTLVVESDKVRREIQVTPKILEQTGKAGIGVAIVDAAIVRYPLWVALPKAFETVAMLCLVGQLRLNWLVRLVLPYSLVRPHAWVLYFYCNLLRSCPLTWPFLMFCRFPRWMAAASCLF